ncbi:hypothetical protein [Streptomyces sp. NPDC055109]
MSRDLQQQLLTHLDRSVTVLDLPLTREQIERLAVELTPRLAPVTGGRAVSGIESDPYTTTATPDGERVVNAVEGCNLSIHPDVAEDSPAALLGAELYRAQSDVLALDVPEAKRLVVTVKPRSAEAWTWWLRKFDAVRCTPDQPCCTTIVGRFGDIDVELRGDGVPDLLATQSATRLGEFMAGHPW